MARYKFYQKAIINGKTIHGLVETVTSKEKALKLINDYNKILTNFNPNLKQVVDFTHPLQKHLDNVKKWSGEEAYKKEVKKLSKHNGLNIENLLYHNKHYSVIKTK